VDPVRLAIGVPTSGSVNANFMTSLLALMGAASEVCQAASLILQRSSSIPENREGIASDFLAGDYTHLMFLDDDMRFQPAVLPLMLSRQLPIVTTNYLAKKLPLEFITLGLDGQRVRTTAESAGVQEVQYAGFGVSVIERVVFEKTERPWFQPDWFPDTGRYSTEDMAFFRRARAAGFPCYVDHDASKLVAHMGLFTWRWDMVDPLPQEEVVP